MKPTEYLADAGARGPDRKVDPKDFLPYLRENYPELIAEPDSEARARVLKSLGDMDWATQLLEILSPRLPSPVRQAFEAGYLAVGERPNPVPGAFTKHLGEDGHAIVFNSGMFQLIYRVARCLSATVVIDGDTKVLKIEDFARVLGEVVWWFGRTEKAFGPGYQITRRQIEFATALAVQSELFLLGHEIGHALIYDVGASRIGAWRSYLGIGAVTIPNDKEQAADALSLLLITRLPGGRGRDEVDLNPLIYAGAEFAITVYCALERAGMRFKATHPSAESRLLRLRESLRLLQLDEKQSEAFTQLASFLSGSIRRGLDYLLPGNSVLDSFRQKSSEALERLETALKESSEGYIPNYAAFLPVAGELLNQISTPDLLNRVRDLAATFKMAGEEMERNPNPVTTAMCREAANKFKLIISLVDRLPEPAKTVIQEEVDVGWGKNT